MRLVHDFPAHNHKTREIFFDFKVENGWLVNAFFEIFKMDIFFQISELRDCVYFCKVGRCYLVESLKG